MAMSAEQAAEVLVEAYNGKQKKKLKVNDKEISVYTFIQVMYKRLEANNEIKLDFRA